MMFSRRVGVLPKFILNIISFLQWPMSEVDPLPPRPRSYWYPALCIMLFCCTPCGVIALIFAYQVYMYIVWRSHTLSVNVYREGQTSISYSPLRYCP